jgi:APA family basic amino acid/polyamine antiporter
VPIGIMASLAICTVFYIVVAAVMTGMVPYTVLNVAAPLAEALSRVGLAGWSAIISFGAIFGLSSVVMVLMMGMPRIWFAMARDGLMPKIFSVIHPKFRTPWLSTLINGVAVALITGFLRLDEIAELTNVGTLTAFIVVAIGVWMLRVRHPEMHRGFKTPALPAVATITVIICGGLLADLLIKKPFTAGMFAIWVILGVVVYFSYGIKHSELHKASQLPPGQA